VVRHRLARLGSWATCFAFVAGLLFPLWGGAHFLADDDPACGPSGFAAHAVEQFVPVQAAPGVDHCVLCHSWRLLGSAAAGERRDVLSWPVPVASTVPSSTARPARFSPRVDSSRAPMDDRALQGHA
jgi:hypothetical protein